MQIALQFAIHLICSSPCFIKNKTQNRKNTFDSNSLVYFSLLVPNLLCLFVITFRASHSPTRCYIETQSNRSEHMTLAKPHALVILLADDSLPGLMTVKITLEKMGHTCVTATDGSQALTMAAQHHYDVIFLDEQMPGLHGSTICSQLRHEPGPNQHSRIISLSGENNSTQLEKISEAGFDELLHKPVTREVLEQCLGDNTKVKTGSQPPAAVSKNRLLNESSLGELTVDLGLSTALHLLKLFNTELQAMIDRLAGASKNNDEKEILAVAHILKNSAKLYGADLLAAEAQSLNETTKADLNSILLEGRLLELRCSQSQAAVTQYIFENSPK
tara:strand:+ start:28333 stop:29325 length:993 start_codon:yes stop_codon:yes gene_type:complete